MCLISTVGGHLAQLTALGQAIKGHESYLVTVPSPHSKNVLADVRHYQVRQVLRNPVSFLVNLCQSVRIYLRERPDVVVTTGAGDALPTVLIAAALGSTVVFVESFARVRHPSLFGRLAQRWSDLVLYQWPDLVAAYPDGVRVAPLFHLRRATPPPPNPTMLILTGTHTLGFERLLVGLDTLIEKGQLRNNVTAQIGHSTYVPRTYRSFRFLPHDELMKEIDRADVIVTHDGSASMGESLSRGKPTIVVPRQTSRREVSYASEQQLARHLASLGYVLLLENPLDLPMALTRLGTQPTEPTESSGLDAIQVLSDFLEHPVSRKKRTEEIAQAWAKKGAGEAGSLRVIVVTPISPWGSRASGIRSYVNEMISGLSKAGAKVAVVTIGASPERTLPGVLPVVLSSRGMPSSAFLAFLLFSGSKLRKRGQIIHLQRLDHVLAVLPWARSIPRVVTLHGEAARSIEYRKGAGKALVYRMLERLGARFADALVAVDSRTRTEYERMLPSLKGRITVIPVGVSTPRQPGSIPKFGVQQPQPSTNRLIVYAGRLEPEKNVGLLIEAFTRLRTHVSDASLSIVGSGRSETDLRRQAEATGLSIEFLPPLPQDQLWQLLSRADVVAVPSLFESGPLVALEAVTLGTPVVTTPVGRIQGIIEHWPVGKVSAASAREFAEALAEVLARGKPQYRDACMSAAKELSFQATFDETLRVYRFVLGGAIA